VTSISEAVPKRILELMNVPGLTRENVASHLQVYFVPTYQSSMLACDNFYVHLECIT
jgi:hypothetical protein